MDPQACALIDVTEAAYDLQRGPEEWLPNLLEKGSALFDLGLGCTGALWAGQSAEGRPRIAQMCVEPGPPDLPLRFARAARDAGPELTTETLAGEEFGVRTASESSARFPGLLDALERHVGCKDVLGIWAVDSSLHGVGINTPSATRVSLSKRGRQRWERVAVHVANGDRLRRRLGCTTTQERPIDPTTQAEALIDPKGFRVVHAAPRSECKSRREDLREAAMAVDAARSRLRGRDPDRAMELWDQVVRGRCSVVDWFDSDKRRYMVVIANDASCTDPRGLDEREYKVATLAAQGASSKRIGYELGVSRQRISALLHSAMRKLGVRTQPELVLKMSGFRRSGHPAA